ncbi:coiled-coil domain-containing protein 55-domain containing protein [Phellopilus nigrolimitatus]|nr:coiled-coil domain-containing protein 55-domain containing protein [Phellopilus nigrolimitatus]
MKVSFSLNKSKPAAGSAPSLKQPAAFASLGDDEPLDAAPTASGSSSKGATKVNKTLAAQAAPRLSKAQQKRIEAERRVDASVYEYDEVWDRMQAAKARQKEKKEVETLERKPKYINSLLQSATIRKLDHLRAEEKMIQREREAEGDEFAEKDQFVTQAYKDQMAEVRRAEAEEKQREELEKAKRGPSTGMTHFYRQLLEQTEEQHSATVAATTEKKKTAAPENLTITKPTDYTPVSDLERAAHAREEGKTVELNDDNQIVDKRELLSAGLNLSAPNTRRLGLNAGKRKAGSVEGDEPVVTNRAVGSAASQREINERRRREIQQQLADETERTAQELEERERQRAQRMVVKRNTEDDVKSARERYLERKRRKLETPTNGDEGKAGDGT